MNEIASKVYCDRCWDVVDLDEETTCVPSLVYHSGVGESALCAYKLCLKCRSEFVRWFDGYLEQDLKDEIASKMSKKNAEGDAT